MNIETLKKKKALISIFEHQKVVMKVRKLDVVLVVGLLVFSFSSCKKKGCTYENATNYDAKAETDDGSCIFSNLNTGDGEDMILGCTDANATNYDSLASVDDGSCTYAGCTDINAQNYDPNATIDDGSCTYARDKFLGDFSVTNDCGTILAIGENSSISSVSTGDTVSISNFVQGSEVLAVAQGNTLTIFEQATGFGGLTTISGTGTLQGTTINFFLIYSIENPFQPIMGTCEATFTK